MNLNILTDYLPTTIEVQGVRYPINWDFRTSILFEQLMMDDNVDEEKKPWEALNLYFGYEIETIKCINTSNMNEFTKQMLLFYRCGKEIETSQDNGENNSETQKIYDYEYDGSYIYAAFLQIYRIDLQDIEDLHWWKFKALFNSLTDDCKFMKILGYRNVDLSKIKDKERKNFYKQMKKIYALPGSIKEKEKQALINEMLMRGEDPRELLRQ